jgi:ubiquinone/menaquinone biosynthesis C-methylase UbiE
MGGILPRRMEMWERFDACPGMNGPEVLGRIEELAEGDRQAADFFIATLGNCRTVLDVGCGAGLPALHLAQQTRQVTGIDMSPRMIAAAQQNAAQLGIHNISFQIASTTELPFADHSFDGASLLGVLESMAWPQVETTLTEVVRVMKPGGIVAILDTEWHGKTSCETWLQDKEGELALHITERFNNPSMERDTHYLLKRDSDIERRARKELAGRERGATKISINELVPEEICDAWYCETAQFDAQTLRELVKRHGFHNIEMVSQQIWGQPMLLMTARRA